MLKTYRNIKITTKLIGLGLVLLITGALAIRMDYNVPIALSAVGGFLIIADVLINKPKTIISVIVAALQFFIVSYASYYFGAVYAGLGADFVIYSLITLALLGTSTVVITWLALKYSKGRIWITLLFSYLVLDLSGFFIGGYAGLNFVFALIVSAILGVVAVGLRCIKIFNRKLNPTIAATRNRIRNPTAAKTAVEIFEKNGWEYNDIQQDNNSFVIETNKMTAIVFPIGFTGILKKDKKDIFYDGISLGNFFGDIVSEAKNISKKIKVSQKQTSIIVLDTTNKYPVSDAKYIVLDLQAKNDSLDIVNKVIISNNRGLTNYNNDLKSN
jgi:hypothetical protein